MKLLYIYLGIVFPLVYLNNYTDDTWTKIEHKTWSSSEDGIFGTHLVFLEDIEDKKAILQLEGSGCCHIFSVVYDVEILSDTIVLQTEIDSVIMDNKNDSPMQMGYKFVFTDSDSHIVDIESGITYKILFPESRLYKGCCNELDIEKLKGDTINESCFNIRYE